MFCLYPYVNANQPDPGITSTICTYFYNTIQQREQTKHFSDSKW